MIKKLISWIRKRNPIVGSVWKNTTLGKYFMITKVWDKQIEVFVAVPWVKATPIFYYPKSILKDQCELILDTLPSPDVLVEGDIWESRDDPGKSGIILSVMGDVVEYYLVTPEKMQEEIERVSIFLITWKKRVC